MPDHDEPRSPPCPCLADKLQHRPFMRGRLWSVVQSEASPNKADCCVVSIRLLRSPPPSLSWLSPATAAATMQRQTPWLWLSGTEVKLTGTAIPQVMTGCRSSRSSRPSRNRRRPVLMLAASSVEPQAQHRIEDRTRNHRRRRKPDERRPRAPRRHYGGRGLGVVPPSARGSLVLFPRRRE